MCSCGDKVIEPGQSRIGLTHAVAFAFVAATAAKL
jgi:hypothetical protein